MEFREQITIGLIYFLFAYFATLGFWQLIAAWQRLRALSWLGRGVKARWGYLLGSVLIGLACLWFFGTRSREIFSPGPASSEFLFFLSAASLCSLVTTISVSPLMSGLFASGEERSEKPSPHKEPVVLERGQGFLYVPASRDGPCPAICMVPGPGEGIESLETIAAWLGSEGFFVLTVDMPFENSWLYPDIMILCTKAIPYLESRDEVDSNRIGAMGVGLAGDLVIRVAASDPQIKSVVAVAPLLVESSAQPGLDLLRDMSYVEAKRWTYLHQDGKLVTQLGALEHVSELDSQPLLAIYGEADTLAPLTEIGMLQEMGTLELIPGQGHRGLAHSAKVISLVARWFRKTL